VGRLKKVVFVFVAFFALLFGVVLYWHNSIFILKGPDNGFLLTKAFSVRYSVYLPAFYIHITTGSLVLMAGVLQLSEKVRIRYASLHRNAGKFYIAIILLFTAPSGFIMSLYANGGLWAQTGFALLATLWWYFTWKGWQLARRKDWTFHRQFMIRSYALTFAAVTLRLYSFILALIGFRGEVVYIIIAWLSWVSTLAVAEIWLRRTRALKKTPGSIK
jgi:uncharacterized membrane protein